MRAISSSSSSVNVGSGLSFIIIQQLQGSRHHRHVWGRDTPSGYFIGPARARGIAPAPRLPVPLLGSPWLQLPEGPSIPTKAPGQTSRSLRRRKLEAVLMAQALGQQGLQGHQGHQGHEENRRDESFPRPCCLCCPCCPCFGFLPRRLLAPVPLLTPSL